MPNPYAAGDKLLATQLNQSLPITLTAGETINGATLPVAVYMDDTDNEVKTCDGNDNTKMQFIGFAISNSTDGNNITVQTKGIVDGFSGLDTGKKYFVQDDKTIGTSIGTYEIFVGIAISATQLLIFKDSIIVSGTLTSQSETVGAGASANDDETITTGFMPKIILLFGRCKATAWGDDYYNRGVLLVINGSVIFGFKSDNTINDLDTGNASAAQPSFRNWATSLEASKHDSGTGITTNFTLLSVSATGFAVRTAYTAGASGGGVGAFDMGHYVVIG